jgi:hypothetical protein
MDGSLVMKEYIIEDQLVPYGSQSMGFLLSLMGTLRIHGNLSRKLRKFRIVEEVVERT